MDSNHYFCGLIAINHYEYVGMNKKKKKTGKGFRKYIVRFWIIYFSLVCFMVLFFMLISVGALGFVPTFEELENPDSIIASEVISEDNSVIGKYFFASENRSVLAYKNLPQSIVHALIATEDVRFREHSGVDMRSLFRVVKGVLTGNSSMGGGSTISQQLAKMLFPRQVNASIPELIMRKFKEWVIAVKLERSYTKDEIIAMYLNKYDFLNLAVGIKSASRIYFNMPPDSLRMEQSAMLVGMAKNSSLFNPVRFPDTTLFRRNVVLNQMEKYEYLDEKTCDSLKQLPLNLDFQREDFKEGLASYAREYIRQYMTAKKPDIDDYASWQHDLYEKHVYEWENNPLYGWCEKNKRPDGKPYNIYKDGLRIHTTIDSRMQGYAESAVRKHLSEKLQPEFFKAIKRLKNPPFANDVPNKTAEKLFWAEIRKTEKYRVLNKADKTKEEIQKAFDEPHPMRIFTWHGEVDTVMSSLDSIKHYLSYLRSSMMSVEVPSGHIKAYVGGPNMQYFMYDMATLGKRQPGSTVKPFLYTLAIQNGIKPCEKVPNTPHEFVLPGGRVWICKNSGGGRQGEMVSLQWGLQNSINQVTAWVMKQFSPTSMKDLMQRAGIRSPIDAVPSMFLGTSDATVMEMVGAYTMFPNGGIALEPILVSHIEDKNGKTLSTFRATPHEVIDPSTAYTMVKMMQNVVHGGTASRLTYNRPYGNHTEAIGAKTGTTQKHADGWFMGYTPKLVTGVWTGAELRSIRFPNINMGQGAEMALPVWGLYMNDVLNDTSLSAYSRADKFAIPSGYKDSDYICDDNSTEPVIDTVGTSVDEGIEQLNDLF
ncbi:MAG: transglycosylase domain-containing protein [Bacteroidales bacterium]